VVLAIEALGWGLSAAIFRDLQTAVIIWPISDESYFGEDQGEIRLSENLWRIDQSLATRLTAKSALCEFKDGAANGTYS
jgi:hypothetical protein